MDDMKLYHMEILSTDYVVSITCTGTLDLLYLCYRKSTYGDLEIFIIKFPCIWYATAGSRMRASEASPRTKLVKSD